jgi:hypothetical protein
VPDDWMGFVLFVHPALTVVHVVLFRYRALDSLGRVHVPCAILGDKLFTLKGAIVHLETQPVGHIDYIRVDSSCRAVAVWQVHILPVQR